MDSGAVDDLLNISSPSKSEPEQPSAPPPPASNPLFDDFFTSPNSTQVPPAAKPATDDWQDPWGNEPAVNLNPFDPFGIATEPPEEIPKSHSPPSTPKSPADPFDPFGSRKVVHTSSSTSNLFSFQPNAAGASSTTNAGQMRPPNIHFSSSSSNLTRGNGAGSGNPFEEFGEFFEAAKANSHSQSPSHGPDNDFNTAANAGKSDKFDSFGRFY